MRRIISGTDKQLYDMIIEFHDELFKNKTTDFLIHIDMQADADMSLLEDFVSLVDEVKTDWDGEVTVDFEITPAEDEE